MEYSDSRFKEIQTQLQEYFHDYFSNEDYLFNAFRHKFQLRKPEDNSMKVKTTSIWNVMI